MAVTSKVTAKKQAVVAELKEQMTSAKGVVVTSYRGLTVAQDTQLRRELREAGVTYHVVKNTMMRIAAKEAGLDGLADHLEGTTAMAFSDDAVADDNRTTVPSQLLHTFLFHLSLYDDGVGVRVHLCAGRWAFFRALSARPFMCLMLFAHRRNRRNLSVKE